jgi:hypothetical protein
MKRNRTSKPPKDRLGLAATLLAGAVLFCLLAVSMVVGCIRLRPDAAAADACQQFVRQYGLNTTALMPTGNDRRHSDGRMPNVDLRYDPRLPLVDPNAGLVFQPRPPGYVSATMPMEKIRTGVHTSR